MHHVSCPIDRCSSQPFQDNDLFGCVSVETYIRIKVDQSKLDKIIHRMNAVQVDVECNNQLPQKQQEMLQRLAAGLEWSLPALSLLATNQFKQCPNLVWMTPVSVTTGDLENPKTWIRSALSKNKRWSLFVHTRFNQVTNPLRSKCLKDGLQRLLCLLALKGISSS